MERGGKKKRKSRMSSTLRWLQIKSVLITVSVSGRVLNCSDHEATAAVHSLACPPTAPTGLCRY